MAKNELNPISYEVDYGEIHLNLDAIMNERKITNYKLATTANIRFQTIQNLRQDLSTRIDFDVLAKICYALDCSITDIIVYKTKL